MGGLLHLSGLQGGGGDWAGLQPTLAPSRCTKCNSPPINGHCIPITLLLYNGSLLCGFNVPIKGSIGVSVKILAIHPLVNPLPPEGHAKYIRHAGDCGRDFFCELRILCN